MTNLNIFGIWILTIVIGSIIFSIGLSIFANETEFDFAIGVVAISALMSFLFSIPAVTTFLITNSRLIKRNQDKVTYRRKMYSVHLVVASIYFLVTLFIALINEGGLEAFGAICGILVSYLPVGLIFWRFYFKRNELRKPFQSEDLLDNI